MTGQKDMNNFLLKYCKLKIAHTGKMMFTMSCAIW